MKELKVIAHVENDFPEKFGLPHQSGRIESLKARIVFEPEYRIPEAFRGLEEYSHIWLIWEFSKAVRDTWSPTVRPPRLGGNIRKGVFATRSPFRPNSLGLSCVKLEKIEMTANYGPVLHISGADMISGTPVYDIKPYLPYLESHPEGRGGFTEQIVDHKLQVEISEELLGNIPEEKRETLLEVLGDDPRPGYQKESDKIYGMLYAKWNIQFKVKDGTVVVLSIEEKR